MQHTARGEPKIVRELMLPATAARPVTLVVTDMAVVERIAHRVAVMFAGQIVEIGAATEVLSNPQHSYTKRLISAVPAIERRKQRFTVDMTQVPSLVRPLGFEPPPARWRDAGADHRVREEA